MRRNTRDLYQIPLFHEVMNNNSSRVEENMHLMKTLDDAWNSQDWDTFSKRHTGDVVVRWPGQPPTNGIDAHKKGRRVFL